MSSWTSFFEAKKDHWSEDENRDFNIDPKLVKSFFDKNQTLVFSEKSASIEEKAILPHIEPLLQNKTAKILDLGCGNGRWAEILAPHCQKYVGVDFSDSFIDTANQKKTHDHIEYHCLPAQNYKTDEKFDLIMIIGLITYMDDQDVATLAQNCRRMLNNNGLLVLRNVVLKDETLNRKVYNRTPGLLGKLKGDTGYQIIRRSPEEEKALFNQFNLRHHQNIEGTGYNLYLFTH